MKIYVKANRYQNILDNIVDGNKIWNPLTGEFDTISEERLAELRNPKPVLLSDLKLTDVYVYQDGVLKARSVTGLHNAEYPVYRLAGNYKIYLVSFRDAALPYSKLYVADTETGEVYVEEITQGLSDFKRDIAELVDWLKAGNRIY